MHLSFIQKRRAYFGPHFGKESEKFSVLPKETSCNHSMNIMMWDIALCSTVTSIFKAEALYEVLSVVRRAPASLCKVNWIVWITERI